MKINEIIEFEEKVRADVYKLELLGMKIAQDKVSLLKYQEDFVKNFMEIGVTYDIVDGGHFILIDDIFHVPGSGLVQSCRVINLSRVEYSTTFELKDIYKMFLESIQYKEMVRVETIDGILNC